MGRGSPVFGPETCTHRSWSPRRLFVKQGLIDDISAQLSAVEVQLAPYRKEALIALCAICKEIADTACCRCAAPLCDEHDHGTLDRCAHCEGAFRSHELDQENRLNRRLAWVGAATSFCAAIASSVFLDGVGAVGLWVFVSAALVVQPVSALTRDAPGWRKRLRRRFLRQLPPSRTTEPRLLAARRRTGAHIYGATPS